MKTGVKEINLHETSGRNMQRTRIETEYTEQISDLNVLKKPNKDHDEVSKIQGSGKIKININRHKTNT
jgi:hypothetical protein